MKNTLIIVTDLGLFKAYRLERTAIQQTPRLELIEELEALDAHGKLLDKVTDQAGRWRVPTARMAMSYGERQKIDLEMRRRLIKQMAEHISRVLREQDAEECYLSTNKETHKQLWEELEPDVRKKIVKVLPLDLTKANKSQLLEHFAAEVV
jgi:hypothetical protein